MKRPARRSVAIGTGFAMVPGLLTLTLSTAPAVSAPAAGTTFKACVHKKSGELRMLTKKKCKKGWKKITWTGGGPTGPTGSQGPQGPAGPAGPNLLVRDGTGTVLGTFGGTVSVGMPIMGVIIDGGLYMYLGSGQLYPWFSPAFFSATCDGPAVGTTSNEETRNQIIAEADGYTRLVYRKTDGGLGPARAWKITREVTTVTNAPRYTMNSAGACVFDSNFTGYVITLTEVPAPPDVPPPLIIG